MFRIGKKPIKIPQGVDIKKEDSILKVSGPKGELVREIHSEINVEMKEEKVFVSLKKDEDKASRKIKALLGLYRSLINNMIIGVSEGFKKDLEISGVGYKAEVKDENLVINIGFSHPVIINKEKDIEFSTERNTITVSGIDKEKVGIISAKIRKIRKDDPYKNKGIKYAGEKLLKKEGKKAVGSE